MQRCSNCGAAVRPGAKFCTSCGTRLNLDQAPAASWDRPAATDETLVATPAVTPEPETDTPARDQTESETATDPGAAQGADAVTGSPWRWGATAASDEPAPAEASPEPKADAGTSSAASSEGGGATWSWGQQAQSATPAEPEPESVSAPEGDVTAEPVAAKAPSWTSRWPVMSGEEEDAPQPDDSLGGTPDGESPADRFADALDEAATDTGTDEAVETAASTTDDVPAPASSLDQPLGADEEIVTESETTVPAAELSGAGAEGADVDATALIDEAAASADDSARQRASALLDELRSLLPQIGGVGVATTIADTGNAVADDLSRARDQAGEFSSLRRTLESARDNPRDVDTMLDLVNRADRLLALLDSHDALARAVDDATARLRRS